LLKVHFLKEINGMLWIYLLVIPIQALVTGQSFSTEGRILNLFVFSFPIVTAWIASRVLIIEKLFPEMVWVEKTGHSLIINQIE
jgi:hypothetical protein